MEYYTVAQAAKKLGLSPSSVGVYVWKLGLGKKFGKSYMLTDDDLAILEKRGRKVGRPRGEKRKGYDPEKRAERYSRAKNTKK